MIERPSVYSLISKTLAFQLKKEEIPINVFIEGFDFLLKLNLEFLVASVPGKRNY